MLVEPGDVPKKRERKKPPFQRLAWVNNWFGLVPQINLRFGKRGGRNSDFPHKGVGVTVGVLSYTFLKSHCAREFSRL